MRRHLAFVCVLVAGSACAIADDEDETLDVQPESPIRRMTRALFDPMGVYGPPAAEPFRLPSKYYGLWEPTELFGRDARCAPTPFAPRGYGFPKKLSAVRMDYTPYRLQDHGLESIHGPSLWLRHHRDPCCGADGCCSGCCEHLRRREVDPQ